MSNIKTTIEQIVRYWEPRQDECGLSVDWADAGKRCWRCTDAAELQRCHIIPSSLNGPDTASNFVLLCFRCHRDAPNTPDSDFIWKWLRAYAASCYGFFWFERALQEFERIYQRKAFVQLLANAETGTNLDSISQQMPQLMKQEFGRLIAHYGEGMANASSMAWALAQVEKKMVNLAGHSEV